MARVEIASQGWGTVLDGHGNGQSGLAVTFTTLTGGAVTVYAASTGGTTQATTTDTYGRIPGFVEEGTYNLTVSGYSVQVEAVSAASVASYGVDVTGATDSSAGLQSALDANVGRAVSLRGATLLVGGSRVTFPSNTTLVGPGKLVINPTPDLYPLYAAPGAHDIRLWGFEVDGNKANIAGDPDVLAAPGCAMMFEGSSGSPCQRIYVEDVYQHDSKRLGFIFQNVQTGRAKLVVKDNDRDGFTLYFNCRDIDYDLIVSGCGDDYLGINSGSGATVGLCERINGRIIAAGPSSRSKGRALTVRGGRQIGAHVVAADTAQSAVVLNNFNGADLRHFDIHVQAYRPGLGGSSDKFGVRVEAVNGGTISRGKVTGRVVGAYEDGVQVRNAKTSPADDDIRDVTVDVEVDGAIAGTATTVNGISVTQAGVNDCGFKGKVFNCTGWGFTNTAANKRLHVDGKYYRNTSGGVQLRNVTNGWLYGEAYDDRAGGSRTQLVGYDIQALAGTFDFFAVSWGHITANYSNGGSHTATFTRPYRTIVATATWDPANIADGAMTSTTVTLTPAVLGDQATASFSEAVPAGAILGAQVTSADTVTVTLFNKTGGALDLASGTVRVELRKWL